jgi:ABC-type lipoprotein export system ATPase subunit
MNFKLTQGPYKSIKSLAWDDIPEFVVITGKNGSGKTQLLELLDFHFCIPETTKHQWWQPNQVHNAFNKIRTESDIRIADKEAVFVPSVWQIGNLAAVNTQTLAQIIDQVHNHIIGVQNNQAFIELGKFFIEKIGKPGNQITKEELNRNFPIDYFDYITKIQIYEGLSEAFITYYCKFCELLGQRKSHDEAKDILGESPWDIINGILSLANFPYLVNKPETLVGNYMFQLVSKNDSTLIINFQDLSSGEKVLISLSIWIYNAKKNKRLPKLLLLDEPDAHLHPSAVKQLIDVLEKSLVKEYGVRVIMTTHSPSTVSLSPPYALYEMSKDEPRIRPLQSKEYGISLLTEGLVLVKENSKYVLVEDEIDAKFYTEIFSILRNESLVDKNIPIVFISVANKKADKSGGCTVVIHWVNKFNEEGAEGVFQGLIDNDNGTNVKEVITPTKILHTVNRYSLENYLLDPILVYCSLLHENNPIIIPGISFAHKDEHKVSNSEESNLQIIADHIFNEIESALTDLKDEEKEKIDVKFINNKALKYPKWFINRRGHNLYSQFKLKYSNGVNYDKLINTLNRQQFVPIDFHHIFIEIQK